MKGIVCGSTGLSRLLIELDHSLDPTELGLRNSSHQHGVRSSSACCVVRRQVQGSARCTERAGPQPKRYCATAACQTGAHECTGRNTWMQSSPTLVPDRDGVCFEDLTFSQLSGRLAIPLDAERSCESGVSLGVASVVDVSLGRPRKSLSIAMSLELLVRLLCHRV